jgi:hypothetical protein
MRCEDVFSASVIQEGYGIEVSSTMKLIFMFLCSGYGQDITYYLYLFHLKGGKIYEAGN